MTPNEMSPITWLLSRMPLPQNVQSHSLLTARWSDRFSLSTVSTMTVRNRKPNTNGARLAPFRRGGASKCTYVWTFKISNETTSRRTMRTSRPAGAQVLAALTMHRIGGFSRFCHSNRTCIGCCDRVLHPPTTASTARRRRQKSRGCIGF